MAYNISETNITKITNEFNKFSKLMCNIIKENYLNKLNALNIKGRNGKITVYDAIIHKLLYARKGESFSKQQCTDKINFKKEKKINRTTYTKKQNKFDIIFYDNLSNAISTYMYNDENIRNYDDQIYLVDGTRMYTALILSLKYEYKISKSKTFTDLLANVVYDSRMKIPISFNTPKNLDERQAFLDFISKNKKYWNAIFIFDRGYFSYHFICELKKYGIRFIMRLETVYKFLEYVDRDDCQICLLLNNRIQKIRIVQYNIENSKYILATNLYDQDKYPINTLKNYYHDRWDVEEYIKACKKYTKCEVLHGTTENSIQQMVFVNMIMTQIEIMIEKIISKYASLKYHKINKNSLYCGIYDQLLFKLLNDEEIDFNFTKNFISAFINFIPIQENRYYDRKCNIPAYKWWAKQDLSVQHQKQVTVRENNYSNKLNNKKKNKLINNPIFIVKFNGKEGKVIKIISEKDYSEKDFPINDND